MLLLQLLLVALSASDWIHAYEIGDCGIRYNAFIPSVAIGIPANLNEFPWHVALYRMDNSSKHEYICGGTIIDTDIVVTAAICVFDEQQQDVDKSRMIIAAGKHNSSWEHRDMHEQRFEVISKNIPPKYFGVKNRFENDIALLRLNSSIKFSSVVMPACVDWSGSYELKGGEVGTITGWGDTVKHKLAEKLQIKRMQHLDFTDCIKNISSNISPFLTGDKFCAKNYDNSSVEMGDAGGGLMFSKNQGEKETDARYFIKGILSTKERESSIAFYTSVADHLPWIISILSPNSSHHNLGLSGTDLKNAYEIGDCGIEYDKFEPSVVLGEAQKYNDFPWNAALYRMNEKSKYEFICGGTIISANAVITAAFCVYDEIKENMDTSRMAIAVGKSNSSWEHRDVHEQRYEVVSKKTPPRYRGVRGRYEDDIALLALNDSIKFSSAVTPACIDWGLSFEPYDGEVGSVIGWGDYVKRTFSEKTKVKRMQHLSFTQCHKNISQSYSSFLTSDKFCTKNYDGTKVERGDGGSGLVFIRQDNKKDVRYFVKGILESREVGGSTVLFTNISDHIPWLYTTLTAVNHEYKLGKDH